MNDSNKLIMICVGYHEEGFLYLQYAIDRTLTREFLNSSELENYNKYDIRLQRYPYPSFIDDKYILVSAIKIN